MLYVQFWAPDDGRKTHLKHVERRTEINKFEKSRISLVVLWEYVELYLHDLIILARTYLDPYLCSHSLSLDVKAMILPYRNYELGVAAACMALNHALIKWVVFIQGRLA